MAGFKVKKVQKNKGFLARFRLSLSSLLVAFFALILINCQYIPHILDATNGGGQGDGPDGGDTPDNDIPETNDTVFFPLTNEFPTAGIVYIDTNIYPPPPPTNNPFPPVEISNIQWPPPIAGFVYIEPSNYQLTNLPEPTTPPPPLAGDVYIEPLEVDLP